MHNLAKLYGIHRCMSGMLFGCRMCYIEAKGYSVWATGENGEDSPQGNPDACG